MKRTHLIGTMATAVLWALLAVPIASGVGTGGTGLRASYIHAAIAPAPGVVVNGVNFDPSQAMITINGQDQRTPDELRPGMVAGIDGVRGLRFAGRRRVDHPGPARRNGTGAAGRLGRHRHPRRRDPGGAARRRRVDGCTLADIGYGTTIDVYGYSDGVSGSMNATRIECTGASNSTELHGVASAVTLTTMVVHGVTIDITNATFVGFTAPTAGDLVSVVGVMIGQEIFATTVTNDADDSGSSNGEDAEVEDAIGAVISPSVFVVDQFEIDATHATFSGGTAVEPRRRARRPRHRNGRQRHPDRAVGRVRRQRIRGRRWQRQWQRRSGRTGRAGTGTDTGGSDSGTGSGGSGGGTTYMGSVSGTISTFTSTASFVVRGMTIDASTATIVNGAATDLSVGAYVYVVGPCNGKSMKAAKIKIGGGGGTGGSDDESDDDEHEGSKRRRARRLAHSIVRHLSPRRLTSGDAGGGRPLCVHGAHSVVAIPGGASCRASGSTIGTRAGRTQVSGPALAPIVTSIRSGSTAGSYATLSLDSPVRISNLAAPRRRARISRSTMIRSHSLHST